MAYNKAEKYELAKKVIVEHKLFFIEDIPAFIGINKTTLYDFWPLDSNELNELKALLEVNRVTLKVSMRSKWYKSNAPALQMALMKLIGTDEERKILSMQFAEVDQNNSGELTININNRIV